jgi:hypothetical protein
VWVPVSVVVPAPICVTRPVPEMTPAKLRALERLKTSVPLSTTSPVIEPVVPPLPSCRVPPEMVVPPL